MTAMNKPKDPAEVIASEIDRLKAEGYTRQRLDRVIAEQFPDMTLETQPEAWAILSKIRRSLPDEPVKLAASAAIGTSVHRR
jgi:hypothetical protein